MFGSDWPVCLDVATYAEVVGLMNDMVAELDLTSGEAGGNILWQWPVVLRARSKRRLEGNISLNASRHSSGSP